MHTLTVQFNGEFALLVVISLPPCVDSSALALKYFCDSLSFFFSSSDCYILKLKHFYVCVSRNTKKQTVFSAAFSFILFCSLWLLRK